MLSWEAPLVARKLSACILQAGRNNAHDEFPGWYEADRPGPFSKLLVQEYRTRLEVRGLTLSTINIHLTAIRAWRRRPPEPGGSSRKSRPGSPACGERANWASARVSGSKDHSRTLLAAPEPEH